MAQTTLIHTDLTVASLASISSLVQNKVLANCSVVLVHRTQISDSITELLYFDQEIFFEEHAEEGFLEAFSELEQDLARNQIAIGLELFFGKTKNAFRHFCDAHDVELILLRNPNSFIRSNSEKEFTAYALNSSFSIGSFDENCASISDVSNKLSEYV